MLQIELTVNYKKKKAWLTFISRLVIYHLLQIFNLSLALVKQFSNFPLQQTLLPFLQAHDILEYFIHIDTITTIQVTKVTEYFKNFKDNKKGL